MAQVPTSSNKFPMFHFRFQLVTCSSPMSSASLVPVLDSARWLDYSAFVLVHAQVGYWSLFVDGSFESGMSHKGATYINTNPLSADTKFQVGCCFN